MDNLDVLASLEAKSRTTTVEALAKRGRTSVRVIRAADVALMVQESVERAIEISGLIGPDAIEEVKAQASVEFERLKAERVAEAQRVAAIDARNEELAHELDERAREFEKRNGEVSELRQRLAQALAQQSEVDVEEVEGLRHENAQLQDVRADLEREVIALRDKLSLYETQALELRIQAEAFEELRAEHRLQLSRLEASEVERSQVAEQLAAAEQVSIDLTARVRELEAAIDGLQKELGAAKAQAPAPQQSMPVSGDSTQALLMLRLMDEIQALKHGHAVQAAPAPQPVAAAVSTDTSGLEEKLARIVGSLDQKIEKMGKKMGVSSAIDSEVDFKSLVNRAVDDSQKLESNIDNLETEKRAGAGIAANLARIKKLKGGA